MTAVQYPSTVEVPTVQPTQLPNLPGNGGVTVTNDDPTYSVDVSIYAAFPANQTQTLQAHQSTMFPAGSPVWARVTPGQSGSPSSVNVSVYPGSPSPPQGSVIVPNQVTVNGTVDVSTISGTVDANITNANLPVSGSVDANITNASLTVGGTVSLTAGQVVEVTNAAGGSLTVAGTVDANVAGNVTIDAGTVNVQPVEGKLLASPVGPVVQAVTVDVTATALYITGPITANIWVQGETSGAIYNTIFAGGGVPGFSNIGLWVCPINPAEDISYNVYSYIGSGVGWSITEVFTGAVTLLSPAIDGGPNEVQLANPSGSSFTTTFDPSSEVVLLYAYDVLGSGGGLANWPTIKTNLSNPNSNLLSARPISHAVDSGGHQSTIWEIAVMPSIMADNPAEIQIEVIWQVSTTCYVSKRSRGSGLPTCPTSWTVTVPQPAAGANWSYTLPFTARLKMVQAVFAASAAVGTRQPVLIINNGPSLTLSAAGFTASSGGWMAAYPGGPVPPQLPGGSNVNERGMPDLVLPAGATISTGVGGSGIQAGDQWRQITLTFAAV